MDQNTEIKNSLIITRIIYFSLAAGQILFLLVTHFVLRSNQVVQEPDFALKITVPAALFLGAVGGYRIFMNILKKLPSDNTLPQKLIRYRSAFIILLASTESAVLFAIVTYLMTGFNQFLLMALIGLLWFVAQYPSARKIATELKLANYEKEQLNKSKTI